MLPGVSHSPVNPVGRAVESNISANFKHIPTGCVPQGIEAIYSACIRAYPTQRNPLQVTTKQKCWLGGPDPLDFVSMFSHAGIRDRNIPPHWHYVSFGLSDLYGDGRIHPLRSSRAPNDPQETIQQGPSGFGFELTFRLRKEHNETAPPTWPATVMQSIATYVFRNEKLMVGDFISWHGALDGATESRVKHILLADDCQLPLIDGPFGFLKFIQLVGVCEEELKAAQKWSGLGVLNLLRSNPVSGGPMLITNLRRGETIFELNPSAEYVVEEGVRREGSNLTAVNVQLSWEEWKPQLRNNCAVGVEMYPNHYSLDPAGYSDFSDAEGNRYRNLSEGKTEEIRNVLRKGLNADVEQQGDFGSDNFFDDTTSVRPLNMVAIRLSREAGSYLPLIFEGRLSHGRHFTFANHSGAGGITFLTPSVGGCFVDLDHPIAHRGNWLQVMIKPEDMPAIMIDLSALNPSSSTVDRGQMRDPLNFEWFKAGLKIIVDVE